MTRVKIEGAPRSFAAVVALLCVLALALCVSSGSAWAEEGPNPSGGFAVATVSDSGLSGQNGGKSEYRQLTGAVTFTFSEDDAFVMDSAQAGDIAMAAVSVDLAEVCKVDLDAYGLSKYKLAAPDGADCEFECTLLQLLVYMAQRHYSGGVADLKATGAVGSLYLTDYWGGDQNFLYYVNGQLPYDSESGRGVTADAIALSAGDDIAVMRYSGYDFAQDPACGFHFFTDEQGAVVRNLTATVGRAVPLHLQRAWGSLYSAAAATYNPEAGWTLYWGAAYPGAAGGAGAAGSVATDAQGRASLTFDTPGEYCVWADGGKGEWLDDMVVNSPTLLRVKVLESQGGSGSGDNASGGASTAGNGSSASSATGSGGSSGSASTAEHASGTAAATTSVSTKTASTASKTSKKKTARKKSSQKIVCKAKVSVKAKAKRGRLAKRKVVNVKKLARVKAKTALSFKKANKAGGGKVRVAKNGKVTLSKGLKAGVYKVKLKVSAKATSKYKAAKARTIMLTVRIR